MARQVATARHIAAERMYSTLSEAATSADTGLPSRLTGLLAVLEGQRVSRLELLRTWWLSWSLTRTRRYGRP